MSQHSNQNVQTVTQTETFASPEQTDLQAQDTQQVTNQAVDQSEAQQPPNQLQSNSVVIDMQAQMDQPKTARKLEITDITGDTVLFPGVDIGKQSDDQNIFKIKGPALRASWTTQYMQCSDLNAQLDQPLLRTHLSQQSLELLLQQNSGLVRLIYEITRIIPQDKSYNEELYLNYSQRRNDFFQYLQTSYRQMCQNQFGVDDSEALSDPSGGIIMKKLACAFNDIAFLPPENQYFVIPFSEDFLQQIKLEYHNQVEEQVSSAEKKRPHYKYKKNEEYYLDHVDVNDKAGVSTGTMIKREIFLRKDFLLKYMPTICGHVQSWLHSIWNLALKLELTMIEQLPKIPDFLSDVKNLQLMTNLLKEIDGLAKFLPEKATRSPIIFFDCLYELTQYSKLERRIGDEVQMKISTLCLGIGFFNRDGRIIWKRIVANILYNFERVFKYRRYNRQEDQNLIIKTQVPFGLFPSPKPLESLDQIRDARDNWSEEHNRLYPQKNESYMKRHKKLMDFLSDTQLKSQLDVGEIEKDINNHQYTLEQFPKDFPVRRLIPGGLELQKDALYQLTAMPGDCDWRLLVFPRKDTAQVIDFFTDYLETSTEIADCKLLMTDGNSGADYLFEVQYNPKNLYEKDLYPSLGNSTKFKPILVEFQEKRTKTVVVKLLEQLYQLYNLQRYADIVKPSQDMMIVMNVMEKYLAKDPTTIKYCNQVGGIYRLQKVTHILLDHLEHVPENCFYQFIPQVGSDTLICTGKHEKPWHPSTQNTIEMFTYLTHLSLRHNGSPIFVTLLLCVFLEWIRELDQLKICSQPEVAVKVDEPIQDDEDYSKWVLLQVLQRPMQIKHTINPCEIFGLGSFESYQEQQVTRNSHFIEVSNQKRIHPYDQSATYRDFIDQKSLQRYARRAQVVENANFPQIDPQFVQNQSQQMFVSLCQTPDVMQQFTQYMFKFFQNFKVTDLKPDQVKNKKQKPGKKTNEHKHDGSLIVENRLDKDQIEQLSVTEFQNNLNQQDQDENQIEEDNQQNFGTTPGSILDSIEKNLDKSQDQDIQSKKKRKNQGKQKKDTGQKNNTNQHVTQKNQKRKREKKEDEKNQKLTGDTPQNPSNSDLLNEQNKLIQQYYEIFRKYMLGEVDQTMLLQVQTDYDSKIHSHGFITEVDDEAWASSPYYQGFAQDVKIKFKKEEMLEKVIFEQCIAMFIDEMQVSKEQITQNIKLNRFYHKEQQADN